MRDAPVFRFQATNGFTLLELLVTLAIVAVLLASATPTFSSFLQNQRLAQASVRLSSELRLARHAAVDRNQRVVICTGNPDLGCTGSTQWNNGWIVFEDSNGDRQRQAAEVLIRTTTLLQALSARSSGARTRLSFFPDGSAPGSNSTVWLCDTRGPLTGYRITINLSGRIRAERNRGLPTMSC